eukprot:6198310-Pleurochrysis_carterae.AAC.3
MTSWLSKFEENLSDAENRGSNKAVSRPSQHSRAPPPRSHAMLSFVGPVWRERQSAVDALLTLSAFVVGGPVAALPPTVNTRGERVHASIVRRRVIHTISALAVPVSGTTWQLSLEPSAAIVIARVCSSAADQVLPPTYRTSTASSQQFQLYYLQIAVNSDETHLRVRAPCCACLSEFVRARSVHACAACGPACFADGM